MEIEPIYLFDKNKELIDIIPAEDLTANSQDWTLNGLIKGTVSGVYNESIEQAHFYGTRDIDDPNVFWQYKIVNYTKEDGQFTFEGIYVLFDDLAGRGIIRDRRPKKATIASVLSYVLEETGWQIGSVQSTHKGTSSHYYISKLEAFWDFIAKWRVEFKPRMTFSGGKVTGKYIDIYDRLSDDYGKWYEYGDSLLTVMAEEMRENVFTSFVGRGKGEETADGFGRKLDFKKSVWTVASGKPVNKPAGQDHVEIPWATALYGYEDGTPRTTIIEFPDIEDDDELLESTYEYGLTECRPKIQFKADVLETGRADVGEVVTILRPDMGIRYKTRVFNLRRDFLNGAIKTIQFGEQLVQSTAQRTKKTATAIKKQEEQTRYWLEALHDQLTDTFFNEDGYNYDLRADNEYDLPGGYYSFNAPIDQNPTKVIYMGAGTLAIANSKNPDGSWRFRTWANGDGMTLDAVNTGVLTAGRIQDFSGGSYWDLDNGYFTLRNGEIELFDGTTGDLTKIDYSGVETQSASTGIHTKLKNGLIEFGDDMNIPVGGMSTAEIFDENEYYDGATIFTHYNKFFAINKQWTPNGPYEPMIRSAIRSKGLNIYVPVTIRDTLNMNRQQIHNVDRIYMGETTNGLRTNNGRPYLDGDIGVYLSFNEQIMLDIKQTLVRLFGDLDMNGNTIINQSDIRLKTNVEDSSVNALKEIERMRFIEFEWDKTNLANEGKPEGRQFGIVAQYSPFLQKKAGDSESYLSIDMNKHVNLNSKAIQEIKKENDTLKQELADLKALLTEKGLI